MKMSLSRHVSKVRCRKMAWMNDSEWHWSIVFTDANSRLLPKWGEAYVFGWMNLNVLNTLRTFIGSNDEPNGPNAL